MCVFCIYALLLTLQSLRVWSPKNIHSARLSGTAEAGGRKEFVVFATDGETTCYPRNVTNPESGTRRSQAGQGYSAGEASRFPRLSPSRCLRPPCKPP